MVEVVVEVEVVVVVVVEVVVEVPGRGSLVVVVDTSRWRYYRLPLEVD